MANWLKVLLLVPALLAAAKPLVDFQVAQPPPLPKGAKQCTVEILQHTFANSYGSPAIVQYTPPTDCGTVGSWTGISLNFTVTSNGTQYDRLGTLTFQEVEIWRTSTPEPTSGDGIIWTHLKDVTRYTPLFAKAGTFLLELDNELATGLDGEYATTLHATFYESSALYPPAPQANTIIPLGTLSNTSTATASVPPQFTINATIPQNAVQIYAELYASGNGEEEFWYYNTANEYLSDLPSGTTYGGGPFREVRLLVDGKIAGAALPYAVIFTGGIVPTAWRPITSYGALDLPTYFLDLTPFVPLLTDGKPHTFAIDVVSAETNHTINSNWYVSGNLQVVTDSSSEPTTGNMTQYTASPYAVTATTGSVGANGDVKVTVKATREIQIESTFKSGSGKVTDVVWKQSLSYQNVQTYASNNSIQASINVAQTATGTMLSTHNGIAAVADTFSYPLNINLTLLTPDGDSFTALFDHSYNRVLQPSPLTLGSTINERQLATGYFAITSSGNSGNGTSNNTFSYADPKGNTYTRQVDASLNNITQDHQGGSLAPSTAILFPGFPLSQLALGSCRLPGGRHFTIQA
ncbi:hypothetical protein FIBSPDRAFT_755761 [Athelia psychrophila]|uniref:Peptide N-acetyl-beta-D-glucosaminyl asparaginase amidase A N-terminal domain-containing protein n=1 Tax=Athelia psychrophila TaxID=1759441 RepID=A0A166AUS9_9AGAM|nr:hypothetical protein FIBSPDRAFT_755761 [Fibularhizoctonia sp. CBS 109695]